MAFFRVFVPLMLVVATGTPILGQQSDGRQVLNIGFLTSKSGRFVSSGTIAAAQLALDCINDDTEMLPDYRLELVTYDTKCDEAASLDEYIRHWTNASLQPSPLFFGGGCSIDTGLPGDMSRSYHTVQLAYSAGSPIFSDKARYPYLFRALQPETGIHRGQGVFVKHFGWDEVAMVVQNEHIFSENLTDTVDFMKNELMIQTVDTHIFPSRLPLEGLEALWSNTPRVIIINAYEAYTREILCQALHNNIYYPNYQFIILGWFSEDFWLNPQDDPTMPFEPSCTDAEFERFALRNLITVNFDFLARNKDETAICGLSANSFVERFDKERNETGLRDSDFAGITFDSVYAAALALDVSIPILESNYSFKLEGFTFGDVDSSMKFASVVRQSLAAVNFTGVSGQFVFNENFDRDQFQIIIGRYVNRNNRWYQELVGEIVLQGEPFFQGNDSSVIFPEGIPRDQPKGVNVALYAVMTVLAVACVVCAVICVVVNFVFRNRPYIKMTSPNISYFIPLGAIFLYAIVIATGIPSTGVVNRTVICNFQLWLGSIGFTLIFGGILVRTWRIHFIFNRIVVSKVKAKPPKDWMLIVAIGVFIAIDLVFLIIVTAVPQTRTVATEYNPVASTFIVEVCNTIAPEAYLTVIIVLIVYKSVYLWVGLYLAFETRKVKLKALADSQYIAASVYVSIMTCIAIVPVAIWLREMVDIYYGVLSAILLLGVTTVLALTFLPKMIGLYRYRNADVMEFDIGRNTSSIADVTTSRNVATLQEKVQELTSKLAEFDKSIVDTNDTLAPSDTTIKMNSHEGMVGYNAKRTSELGESRKSDIRASQV